MLNPAVDIPAVLAGPAGSVSTAGGARSSPAVMPTNMTSVPEVVILTEMYQNLWSPIGFLEPV